MRHNPLTSAALLVAFALAIGWLVVGISGCMGRREPL
jgi:hypothetical protein